MSSKKAVLIFDRNRRPEQLAYVTDRTSVLHEAGDQVWVAVSDEQAARFAEQGIVVQFHEDADLIELPAIVFDPVEGEPEPPANLQASQPTGDDTAYFLVQFFAPVDPAWLAAVAELGGTFVQNLPVNGGVFRLSSSEATQVRTLSFVRWVGIYHPAYALSFQLAGVERPFTPAGLRNIAVNAASLPVSDQGSVQVLLFDDVTSAQVRAAVEAAGAVIAIDLMYGFVLHVTAATLTNVLRITGVFAVEPFFLDEIANNRASIILNTNQVRNLGNVDFLVNLDGTGEIVGVFDSGLDTGVIPGIHADLAGRVLQINNLAAPGAASPDLAPHGTHVTGSIAGDGTGSAGRVRGMAPACSIVFHGGPFANFLQAFTTAHSAGARVHNNSWGTGDVVTNNLYQIGNTDPIDRFCFAHPDSLVLFATANHERDIQPAGGDGTLDRNRLSFRAAAKNILAIGATENDRTPVPSPANDGFANNYRTFFAPPPPPPPPPPARYNHAAFNGLAGGAAGQFTMSDNANQVALFSNRGVVRRVAAVAGGHVSTGRIKPDLVAPGTNILSLRSSQTPPPAVPPFPFDVSVTEAPALYQLMHGTSMATPLVSGAAILTRQYYRARFGQLRRPTMLEGVLIPAVPPAPVLVDRPASSPHADGVVAAWVTPALAADPKRILANVVTRDFSRPRPAAAQLQADVGNNPAPALARHGDHTLLVHRHGDASIRLSRYRRDLTADAAFGTNGTVTLAPLSRLDDARPPALLVVGNEAAVVWSDGANDALRFQRFNATTGAAIDANAVSLGDMTQAAPQPYLAHDGTRYAAAWVHPTGATRRIQLRFVAADGTPAGAQPLTVVQGNQELRDPQLTWDGRRNRFVLVWCDARANAGGQIHLQFLDAAGAGIGAEVVAMTVPAASTVRRPRLAPHPEVGYILMWEDNSQNVHFDVYLSFLDDNGLPDGRVPTDPRDPLVRRLVRISDTPDDTAHYTAVVDGSGVAVAWESPDEINSDRVGVYGLNITPRGAFQAQANPNTPLMDSGRYVAHTLLEHANQTLTNVAMVWAGGFYFLLRGGLSAAGLAERQLVRANADGQVDTTFGVNGARSLPIGFLTADHDLHWTGTQLLAATVDVTGAGAVSDQPTVRLFNGAGEPITTFGTNGARRITEPSRIDHTIHPQVGHRTTPAFRAVLVYGAGPGVATQIRYTTLNAAGNTVVAPRDLALADGTARHGWFHQVNSENRAIAVWERQVPGADMAIFVNRYDAAGAAQHAADIRVTPAGGATEEAINAVVGPRPVDINSVQREYGVAWQYRANNAAPWEIRFSRLDRNGQVLAAPPALPGAPLPPPPTPTRDVRVIFPGAAGWPAATNATEPQLVNTFTHEPWANPLPPFPAGTALPAWSPSYGLAWLGGSMPGGPASLFFTVLDENGVRILTPQVPPPPVVGPAPPPVPVPTTVPITQVSRSGVDVREFHLIWNGRTFRLCWTEVEGATVRHMQTALTRYGSQQVYEQPSAALLRATLINGATNINGTTLPNVVDGYGWGRVNLRQSLAPSPPVTFLVRDDNAVGPGRAARYVFQLAAGHRLLRATLTWNDPPGARLINRLHLRIRTAGQTFQGNTWRAAPNGRLSQAVAAGTPFQTINNTEQIVLENPAAGTYTVDVIAEVFPVNAFNQLNAQPFALVLVASGPEVRFGALPAGPLPIF